MPTITHGETLEQRRAEQGIEGGKRKVEELDAGAVGLGNSSRVCRRCRVADSCPRSLSSDQVALWASRSIGGGP